jgi:4-diphosphocytidyl-2C-methyl-D-erythritol kinase
MFNILGLDLSRQPDGAAAANTQLASLDAMLGSLVAFNVYREAADNNKGGKQLKWLSDLAQSIVAHVKQTFVAEDAVFALLSKFLSLNYRTLESHLP